MFAIGALAEWFTTFLLRYDGAPLQEAGLDYDSAEASFVPDSKVPLEADDAGKVFRLIDVLEDLDDVQNLYANFDVTDEVMAAATAIQHSGGEFSS